ncbi:MAG: DNA primase [Clostridium sp.]|nr:DNA primase [Clostridium sp.]HCG33966.1 DNA primase [Oscillospiraceae bacterium]
MKTDIEDVISTYVTLKRRGATLVGLCPFHNEKTPSFTVYPATQSFYCFGCGAGGDAITFLKKIENLDYLDAVKTLAQRAGLQMPQEGFDDSLSKRRRRILEMNREAARFYHSVLLSPEGKVGYDYYIGRALSAATINHFGLGFAPNQWDALLKHMRAKGYQPAELVDAGLVRKGQKGYYDNFRNRVMTPIIDVRGNVIAFGGRVLDDSKPKYINTGDTLVYKKTNELFALNFAKDSKEDALILCEGYMDVIAMHQAGFTNAVAGCGTALTTEQVRLISRYAKEVILTYDADEAGQKALQKAMTLFDQTDVKVRIPALVGGKDPDEIIRTYGRDKFKGMLEGASNETEFRLLALRRQYNLATTQGKIDFIGGALQILATLPPVEQDLYVSRLSEELGVERQNMKVQLQDLVARQGNRREKRKFNRIVQENMRKTARETMATDASLRKLRAEDRLISLLLRYPDCSRLCKDFDPQWLTPGFAQRVFTLILQRLENGDGTELMDLRDRLTDDEMGRLSGIIARGGESADAKQEFSDCLQTIRAEQQKKQESAAELDDQAFRDLFRHHS